MPTQFALRLGDNDAEHRYDRLPRAANTPPLVAQLQAQLRTAGFLFVEENGIFDVNTEWGVREFQCHASGARIARDPDPTTAGSYAKRLVQVNNPPALVYPGAVCGVADPVTQTRLTAWVEGKDSTDTPNNFRCPLVIAAFAVGANPATADPISGQDNLWRATDYTVTAARMFARDLASATPDAWTKAGRYSNAEQPGGPALLASDSDPNAEITALELVGTSSPTGATASTYKVIRAIAESEVGGRFDAVNCYDDATLSAGPFQWKLAHQTTPVGEMGRATAL